jgi:dTDP-4-dehydrorhamnose 3,5-epimerase-like enzyme
MDDSMKHRWRGLRADTLARLEMRDYTDDSIARRLASTGVSAADLLTDSPGLCEAWIPGVEVFHRKVFRQKARGHFAELARLHEGTLGRIGLQPAQWAAASLHRDSAKGFHIHPPHVPEGVAPADWFRELFLTEPDNHGRRPYGLEQWDVMFFLTGMCEMILADERDGMPRRIMRFSIAGDDLPGNDNVAVVIPPGVAHALRSIGTTDLIMVYGTSTVFDPASEGRIASSVETMSLPEDWTAYLESAG